MNFSLRFENRFATLPSLFFTKMGAEGFSQKPYLIQSNPDAARLIDLDPAAFHHPDFPLYFSGNKPLPGAEPLAIVYAGHQFGVYVPQLGDGRALLLGQVRNQKGELWDIQLKGSGLTPYSRFADGRAVLRSTIREFLCSEAMHALSIPTTRALCIVGTGESVTREQQEPGAILTRLSRSHIRFGHFEYFFYTGQHEAVRQLADHVIDEYFPALTGQPDRYALWFREVTLWTARLIAQWQAYGFAHGVMNTDNMSILGLTIDYGPFGFMERFDPDFICNHSDETGRYAFGQQPTIALWNLYALAYALQPILNLERAKDILTDYTPAISEAFHAQMSRRLGVRASRPEARKIWQDLLILARTHAADYTQIFRDLSCPDENRWLRHFPGDEAATIWLKNWRARISQEGALVDLQQEMKTVNPKFTLRNWVAETAIRAAEDQQDYDVLNRIFTLLKAPFDEHPEEGAFSTLPPEELRNLCVSCSS